MNDRRKTGVNRTVIADGNGGRVEVYNLSAGKIQTWLGIAGSLVVILGLVFGAARFGVQLEVEDAIEAEARDEKGAIHLQIHTCAEDYIDRMRAEIQKDLKALEEKVGGNILTVVRIETNQLAIQQRVDGQHLMVMTELRALRSRPP